MEKQFHPALSTREGHRTHRALQFVIERLIPKVVVFYCATITFHGKNLEMSMQTLDVATVLPARIRRAPRGTLAHIPGNEGWPVIGRTLNVLADPKGEVERMAAKYGTVYRTRMLGETGVCLLGPEANEFVLCDQTKLFSSALGWSTLLDRLFPRGLMLLDFEEHRRHRRTISVAFKAEFDQVLPDGA